MIDEQLIGISAQYEALLFVLFPIIIFALIIGGMRLTTGWNQLLKNYPNTLSAPPSKMFHWQSARIGWLRFNNTINFGISPYGLWVKPVAIFNWGMMKPILIPWTDIETKFSTDFWMQTLEFIPKKVPNKKIIIYLFLYEQMKPEIDSYLSTKSTQTNVF